MKDVKLNWFKIILIGFIPIIIIFTMFFLFVKHVGSNDYQMIVEFINNNFGIVGIFLYVYIVDLLILPLSPDFIFPVVASMNPLIFAPLIGIASALGGVTAFYIGRVLKNVKLISKYSDKAYQRWGAYIKKYGVVFVVLAALLPLPFSTICIAAGVMDLKSKKVIPACLCRIIRMGVFFYIFKLGLYLV